MIVTTIGTKVSGRSAWLDRPAALSYARMLEDGCPPGGITDAGRTYSEQAALYAMYQRGELVATAAYPGTSKHETGRALDLREPARAWVRANGHRYGWMKDRVRNEPWHFEYEFARDSQAGRAPKPEPIEEDPMPTPEEIAEAVHEYPIKLSGVRFHTYTVNTNRVAFENKATLRELVGLVASQGKVDPVAVARALAPLLIDAVVEGIGTDLGMTLEQIEDATEKAVRTVLRGV